ncbi:hypothetical protein [Ascidiimonas aurantiaca]|uniref:hypothetical protein n=1 Tax=Ascidiimonas aurantiaca TaxID=1685432 RepID=UPI0030ED3DD1
MENSNFNTLKEKLSRELKVKQIFDFHTDITESRRKRTINALQPGIMLWENSEFVEKDFGFNPIEGSITLFWGYKKESFINELRNAYVKYDGNTLDSLQKKIAKQFTRNGVPTSATLMKDVLEADTLFDFEYNGKQLANNLWLSKKYNIGSLVFPYNGGYISDSLFSIKEHNINDECSNYDYFIVINPPRLSRIERAALDLVPKAQSEINISNPSHIAATPTALVTVVIFVTINTAVTTCCSPLRDRLAEVSLPEKMIDKLSAVNSAKELLNVRANIFREFGL